MVLLRAFISVLCLSTISLALVGCTDDINSFEASDCYKIQCVQEGTTWQEYGFYVSLFLVNSPAKIYWEFGDGSDTVVVYSLSANHVYKKQGIYTITATCYGLDKSTIVATISTTINISSEGNPIRFLNDTTTVSREEEFTLRALCYKPLTLHQHVYWDWGSGPSGSGGSVSGDTLSVSHVYDIPGVYRVIARYGKETVAESDHLDTAYIVVKDYLRPCNADRITITITAAKFLFSDSLLTNGGTPTGSTFELTEFEYIVASYGKQTFELDWKQSQRLNVKTSSWGPTTSYQGYVTLNADGTMIENLDFDGRGHRLRSDTSFAIWQHYVLYQVPRVLTITPSPDYAVYELSGANIDTQKNRFIHRETVQKKRDFGFTRIIDMIQWLPTPDTRIRVVFSKQ